jgi:ABC-type antimicrobial peptide transport system permease subunit
MIRTGRTTGEQARNVKAQIAILIEVNPAGQAGGGAGERTLPEDISRIASLPNVAVVEKYVRKQFVDNTKNPAIGVLIGVEPYGDTLRLSAMGGFIGSPRVIHGRTLTSQDKGRAVAVVGVAFAESRGLKVGSNFTLPAQQLQGRRPKPDVKDLTAEVVGIFSVRVLYGDNQVFVPLALAQEALGIDGEVSQYYVTADSADNVENVSKSLKGLLGDSADVVGQDAAALSTARSMNAVSEGSRLVAAISAAAGALVVFFAMMVVTRERKREIGLMKAIGSSNLDIAGQFTAEAASLGIVGGMVGYLIYALGGSLLASLFVGFTGAGISASSGYSLSAVDIGYGLSMALLFGVVGSLYPIFRAVKMRPSEAMRYE